MKVSGGEKRGEEEKRAQENVVKLKQLSGCDDEMKEGEKEKRRKCERERKNC
jgi:hypothetical protein